MDTLGKKARKYCTVIAATLSEPFQDDEQYLKVSSQGLQNHIKPDQANTYISQ